MSGIKAVSRNSLFVMRYNPQNVPLPVANRYLSKKIHPIYPKIAHMYENADKGTLWWTVGSHGLLAEKQVVRSWCYRRLRTAFRESLRKQGYDEKGRKIIPDPTGKGKPTTTVGQTGTLVLDIFPVMIKKSFKEVQEKADEAVDLLVRNSKETLPTKSKRGPKRWS